MKALRITALVLLACPIFNIESEQPIKTEPNEIAFWCDCGVSIDWRMIPLKGL